MQDALAWIKKAAEGVPQLFEWRAKHKNGRLFWVEINMRRAAVGSQDRLLVVVRDITERRQAEEALERAKELAEYEKNQAEIFLDLMGHDINNINQICIGYIELASESPDAGPQAREMMSTSLKALNRSVKLIENVKKLRRMKECTLQHRVIDVGKLLDDVLPGYLRVPDRDITINYAPDGDCRVMANDLLEDVFSNIVGNAIKHSCDPVTINIRLDRIGEGSDSKCRISIEDNGPGIPDSIKEKLFMRFQNVGVSPDGSGLGLYLVKALVEDFKGTIRVEDRVPGDHSRGSRFVIELPALIDCSLWQKRVRAGH